MRDFLIGIYVLFLSGLPYFIGDSLLPAFDQLDSILSTGETSASIFVSSYMFGLAIGQLIWGLFADRFSPNFIIKCSLLLLGVSLFSTTQVQDPIMLIIVRSLSGFFAAGCLIISRTLPPRLLTNDSSRKMLHKTLPFVGLIAMSAPPVSELLLRYGTVHSIFVASLVFCLSCLGATYWLPAMSKGKRVELEALFRIIKNREFNFLAIVMSQTFMIIYFVLTSIPRMIEKSNLSMTYSTISVLFLGTYVVSSQFTAKSASDQCLLRSFGRGWNLCLIGGAIYCINLYLLEDSAVFQLSGIILIAVGLSFTGPASMASAMTMFPDSRGVASSYFGFWQIAGAALAAGLTSISYNYTWNLSILLIVGLSFLNVVGLKSTIMMKLEER